MMLSILATTVALSLAPLTGNVEGAEATIHQPGNDKVRVRMLASTSRIEPGTPFQLGIALTMDAHWHVYWVNPGESGIPTYVDIAAPDGFEIDPLQFPAPDAFMMPGEVVNFGYGETVMFVATVHPPATFSDDQPDAASFSADVEWLVCQDVCLPGRASADVSVPYAREGQTGRPMYRRQFEAAAALMPKSLDDERESEHRVTSEWMSVDTDQPRLAIEIADADDVAFYPLNGENGYVSDSWSCDRSADSEEGPGTWTVRARFDRTIPGENSPSAPKPDNAVGVLRVTRGDTTTSYFVSVPESNDDEPDSIDPAG